MASHSLQTLRDASDPFDLCDGVFCHLADRHGNQLDVAKESPTERVVTLVWHASGIIGNGGFQYLFEGDFNGDPGFVLTAAAHRKIECFVAAEAFEQALALFPGNKLPEDIEMRLDVYQSIPVEQRDRIDSKYWDANDDLQTKLAAFIRGNWEALVNGAGSAR